MFSTKRTVLLLMLSVVTISFLRAQDLAKVNTGLIVMHPKVSFDGTKLVCIANYLGSLGPYIASIDSGNWGTPEPLFSSEARSKYEFRYPQLNFDNTKIYFSAREKTGANFDIYYSELSKGSWSDPIELPININTAVDELAPAMSTDEKKLLFTRPLPPDAKAAEYCQEIYLTELTETGEWSEAQPLPPSYNTGCVCSPYFSRDNKTFFFSSYEEILDAAGKRLSKNQFNIFWAKIDGFFKFNPKPLLALVGDEDRVSVSMDSDSTIYLGAGKIFEKDQSRMRSQVLSVSVDKTFQPGEMTLISGTVTDLDGTALASQVQIINPFTTKVYQEVMANEQGYYQVFVPSGSQFSILATTEGYSTQSKLIETEGTEFQSNFELFPTVDMTFNVFDEDFYFPIVANLELYDSAFNLIRAIDASSTEKTQLGLGKELNIIFTSENYFADTLNLPFDQEVIFNFFDFDIELKRILKEVSFTFTDGESGNNLGLEIVVYNVTRNEKTTRTVKEGSISLQLRDGEVYEISTSAQGYSYYTADLDLSEDISREIQAELQSVENISIVLDNITFEYNSYTLTATSYGELDKLVGYLSDNEQYLVEISAFTDDSGPEGYNLKLSNLRANSVLQYLQDKSINRERLAARGYGEAQPRYPNDTEENMAKNRRVEFKILGSE